MTEARSSASFFHAELLCFSFKIILRNNEQTNCGPPHCQTMLLLYTAAVVDIELLLPVAATSCCKSVLCIYLEYHLAIV